MWRIFPIGDLSAFHLPMRFIYREALRAGDSFVWSSWLGSGLYLHAEGQTGMAHPFHLLIYRALPLTAAFNLDMLASYVFALAGTWLLLRGFGIRRDAAFAGALVFAFSGFNLLHLNHMNAVAVISHVPWLLWGVDRTLTAVDRRRLAIGIAVTTAALGSQVLLGFPQGVWMGGLAVGWLMVYRVVSGPAEAGRHLTVIVALGLGFAIGGVQLLPTLDAARESFRLATTEAFRLSFSLHPLNLVQLVSPYTLEPRIYATVWDEWFPHELGLYNGAIGTVAVVWIAMRWRTLERCGLALALGCLAAAALILALGRYGGVYPLLAQLPIVSSFRASARHIVLLHLGLAGLTAIAIEDLLMLRTAPVAWSRLAPLSLPPILCIFAVVGGLAAADTEWAKTMGVRLSGAGPAFVGAVFMLSTVALFALAARGQRAAIPALVIVAAVDLAWWGTRYNYEERPVRITRVRPMAGIPAASRRGDLLHPQVLLINMNMYPLWHRRSSLAYLGLVRSSALDPSASVTQRIAGVKWTWTPAGWIPVEDPMPRGRLVTEWRVSAAPAADLAQIDIVRTVLVDAPPGETAGPPGRATLVEERPGRLVFDTNASASQILVTTERFHAGWRVEIDGAPHVSPIRAYGDYLACPVPAGTHRVALKFDPPSFRYGLRVTLVGLLVTAVIVSAVWGPRSGGLQEFKRSGDNKRQGDQEFWVNRPATRQRQTRL